MLCASRCCAFLAAAAAAFAVPAASQEARLQVQKTGVAATVADAEAAALRSALEALVDHEFPDARSSRSREPRWARRVLLAWPESVVGAAGCERVGAAKTDSRGRSRVDLRVSVDRSVLRARWAEAQALCDWLEVPTVAVFVTDRVESDDGRLVNELGEDGEVAQSFLEALQREGFEVRVPKQFEARRKKVLDLASLKAADAVMLQEIASAESADIFVAGYGRVMGPVHGTRVGRVTTRWNSDAKASVFWTDSATQISAASVPVSAGESRTLALHHVGELLAADCVDVIFREWSRWAFEGRTVTVVFTGATSEEAGLIDDAVDALDGAGRLKRLGISKGEGRVEVRLQTKERPYAVFKLLREALRAERVTIMSVGEGATMLRCEVRH